MLSVLGKFGRDCNDEQPRNAIFSIEISVSGKLGRDAKDEQFLNAPSCIIVTPGPKLMLVVLSGARLYSSPS